MIIPRNAGVSAPCAAERGPLCMIQGWVRAIVAEGEVQGVF